MRENVTYKGVEYRPYDHLYSVTRTGKVLRGLLCFEPTVRPDGYLNAGKRLVHRMVAICWLENPTGAKLIHHINHDKTDNRAENLEWVTRQDHMNHHLGVGQGRYVRTEAIRQKLREYRLGKKASKATKRKMSHAMRRLGIKPPSCLGRIRPEEECARMRANNWRNAPCVIRGVRYQSFAEAGRAIGIKPGTLRKRCLSEESFPDYRLD